MSLFFDKEVVTIILDNLISNAIKYTEKGTITLGLHQVVRNNIHHTEISVSDTGFGIAPDALPHILTVIIKREANIRLQEQVLVWLW